MDPFTDFIQTYFVQPILDSSVPGYNPVNTITYGLILLGLAFYVIYPFLNKRRIRFEWNFFRMLIPYILFGSTLRVLEDQHILLRSANPLDAGFYVFTPGIWFLTFALVGAGMLLGHALAPRLKKDWKTISMAFGILISAPLIVFNLLHGQEWIGTLAILALTATISLLAFWIARSQKWKWLENPLAKMVFAGQMLDTSATFVALEFFGCGEQHVLPRLLFGAFGNSSFFFVKIPVVLLVLYYMNKEFTGEKSKTDEVNLYGFILVFLSILGLATGTRDLATVLVGTCSP